ncbi:MAG: nucleotidyltransferase family protein [Bacteroidales bacterium]|nr:nucleotidyltransferase family protein [Bacteroidales bacterium]
MNDLENITAAILVGGLGTRLRSVISDRPKILAEINGRPFLAFLLDQLRNVGIRDVVLCTGYLGKQVEIEFGQVYGSINLQYSWESSPLGTAGAIRLAADLFKSESVLVMNGDSYCDTDLKASWKYHREKDAAGTLLLTRVSDTKRYGRVEVSPEGTLKGFKEKGSEESEGWINAGIYFLSKKMILSIPAGRKVSLEREVFPSWIGRGLYGFMSTGRFLDIGTPESFNKAEKILKSGFEYLSQ